MTPTHTHTHKVHTLTMMHLVALPKDSSWMLVEIIGKYTHNWESHLLQLNDFHGRRNKTKIKYTLLWSVECTAQICSNPSCPLPPLSVLFRLGTATRARSFVFMDDRSIYADPVSALPSQWTFCLLHDEDYKAASRGAPMLRGSSYFCLQGRIVC